MKTSASGRWRRGEKEWNLPASKAKEQTQGRQSKMERKKNGYRNATTMRGRLGSRGSCLLLVPHTIRWASFLCSPTAAPAAGQTVMGFRFPSLPSPLSSSSSYSSSSSSFLSFFISSSTSLFLCFSLSTLARFSLGIAREDPTLESALEEPANRQSRPTLEKDSRVKRGLGASETTYRSRSLPLSLSLSWLFERFEASRQYSRRAERRRRMWEHTLYTEVSLLASLGRNISLNARCCWGARNSPTNTRTSQIRTEWKSERDYI